MSVVAIIAKECVPGHVKTRLHPPFSADEAAELAAACLVDTIATVRRLPADRRVLFFDGDPGTVEHAGFEVLRQPPGGLDERLGFLFDAYAEPLLMVGMDTPQFAPADVASFFETPRAAEVWFGPAVDGGFWSLGMARPDGSLIRGVPMSHADTGRAQRARLAAAHLEVLDLPTLRDVDYAADAALVAAAAPSTAFAAAFARANRSVVNG
jgi:glycosyltransferase A (GT-A) superfamily protein (DUF2064 family)